MTAPLVIGVDLGGTKLLAGAVDAGLAVQRRIRRPAGGEEPGAVVDRIVAAIEEVLADADGSVAAVGVGVPSLVDRRTGTVVHTVHLPLAGVALADTLARRLGLPVRVDNDANVALLAEWRFGAAHGARNAVLLTVGTGIGGGLLVEGRLVRGAGGFAGEPGHMTVDADGPPCPGRCPNRGCLEAMASGTALEREAGRLAALRPGSRLAEALASGRRLDGPHVTGLARDGDEAAREAVAVIGRWLGVGIAGLVDLLDPEVVVVGGGVAAAGDLLLEPAREEARARVLAREPPPIVAAAFGADAGMLGAAVLAREAVGERAPA